MTLGWASGNSTLGGCLCALLLGCLMVSGCKPVAKNRVASMPAPSPTALPAAPSQQRWEAASAKEEEAVKALSQEGHTVETIEKASPAAQATYVQAAVETDDARAEAKVEEQRYVDAQADALLGRVPTPELTAARDALYQAMRQAADVGTAVRTATLLAKLSNPTTLALDWGHLLQRYPYLNKAIRGATSVEVVPANVILSTDDAGVRLAQSLQRVKQVEGATAHLLPPANANPATTAARVVDAQARAAQLSEKMGLRVFDLYGKYGVNTWDDLVRVANGADDVQDLIRMGQEYKALQSQLSVAQRAYGTLQSVGQLPALPPAPGALAPAVTQGQQLALATGETIAVNAGDDVAKGGFQALRQAAPRFLNAVASSSVVKALAPTLRLVGKVSTVATWAELAIRTGQTWHAAYEWSDAWFNAQQAEIDANESILRSNEKISCLKMRDILQARHGADWPRHITPDCASSISIPILPRVDMATRVSTQPVSTQPQRKSDAGGSYVEETFPGCLAVKVYVDGPKKNQKHCVTRKADGTPTTGVLEKDATGPYVFFWDGQRGWTKSYMDPSGKVTQTQILKKVGDVWQVQEISRNSGPGGSMVKVYDRAVADAYQRAHEDSAVSNIPTTDVGTEDDNRRCKSTETGIGGLKCSECFQLYPGKCVYE